MKIHENFIKWDWSWGVRMPELLIFSLLGLLGGFIKTLAGVTTIKQLRSFDSIRFIFLGALMGIVYHFAYSQWTLPNSVMAILTGYAGTSFIDQLVKRAGLKKNKEE